MPLIYITGTPGSGKSTIRQSLINRGFIAYGGAEDNIAGFFDENGDPLSGWVSAEMRTPEWRQKHSWKFKRTELLRLKAESSNSPIYLCGVADNEAELWDLFDKIIVLKISPSTMKHRLALRTNNDVGKALGEFEDILAKTKLREEAYPLEIIEIDATKPIDNVVDAILAVR